QSRLTSPPSNLDAKLAKTAKVDKKLPLSAAGGKTLGKISLAAAGPDRHPAKSGETPYSSAQKRKNPHMQRAEKGR
ncbi:hypothetical protein, partial [Sulfurivirga sp.]|uniref:hypothetical protein n=1 Tax=Sulfurivirga sp. TaxID=2614236 RepID=UPI0025D7C2B6